MMQELKDLVEKLENAYSGRLVSVILYGSGAAADSGDHHHKVSDLNVLCVLKEITPRELADGEPILRWWREHGHPSPLLMSEEEAHRSADCFPIEFRDLHDRRKVLFGVDVIEGLDVPLANYRTQIEYELRSKLLRLRQQGAEVLSQPDRLLKLCVDSVATFCMLGRHALLVSGEKLAKSDAGNRRAVVLRLSEKLGAASSPFDMLLDIREGKAIAPSGVNDLFAEYLQFVRKMVEFVDGLPV